MKRELLLVGLCPLNPQKKLSTKLIAFWGVIFTMSGFTAVDAGVWTDDFGDGILNGWTDPSAVFNNKDWESKWEIQGGILGFVIWWKPVFKHPLMMADVLLLTEFPISAERLSVRVALLDSWGGSLCLALGKTVEPLPGLPPEQRGIAQRVGELYIFGKRWIGHISVGVTGGWHGLPSNAPRESYKEAPISDVKVIFNQGRFQLFSEGKQLADFFDGNYPKIELVGFFVLGGDAGASGHLDNFRIEGPGIPDGDGGRPLQPKGKLVISWGSIKR